MAEIRISQEKLVEYLRKNYLEDNKCKLCGRTINGDILTHFRQYHIRELEEAKLRLAASQVKPAVSRLDAFF